MKFSLALTSALAFILLLFVATPVHAHTNSVGFDLVDEGDGSCTLEWYYGSWHTGNLSPEGAFSLYTLKDGGNPANVDDYTVEAYGTGGEIRNETNFFTWPGKDTANITLPDVIELGEFEYYQQDGGAYTDIADAGFQPGTNYFFTTSGGGALTDISGQNSQTYSHQSATIQRVQSGTYRGFYDGLGSWDDVQPPSSTPMITATFQPELAIQEGLITIASGCRVFFGAVPTILIESFEGDNGFSTNDFVASTRSGSITGTVDSANTDTTTLAVSFGATSFTLSDPELELSGDDWTLALPGPIDPGSHEVTATVTETDATPVSDTITLKIVAASIENITEDDGLSQTDFRTSDQALFIHGLYSASSASQLTVELNGVVHTLGGNASQDALLTSSGDDWVLDLTDTTLGIGTYTVTAKAIEGTETYTAMQDVEVVNAPALPTFDSITDDIGTVGDFITTDDTLIIEGTFEANESATFTIELGGIVYSLADSPELTSSGDNWNLDLTNRALGEGVFTAKATSINSGGWPSTASQDIEVVAEEADLSISSVVATPDPVVAGDKLTYVITIRNDGPLDATGVTASALLPGGVTLNGSSGCAEDPNGVPACSLGDLAVNSEISYNVVLDVDPATTGGTTLTASFAASGDVPDPDTNNDKVSVDTKVESGAPVFDTGPKVDLGVDEDAGATAIDSLLAATDPNTGETLTWSVQSPPSNGTLIGFDFSATSNAASVTPSGLSYAPAADYFGLDSFTIRVSDGTNYAEITVDVTVDPVNDSPLVNAVSETTDEDTSVTLTLRGSDVDGDALTFAIATGPADGRLGAVTSTGSATAEVTYTPGADFNGSDSFTYTASDGTADSAAAIVDIIVNAVNDLPSATDDSVTTLEDEAVIADVLANDAFGGDGPGNSAIAIVARPSNGSTTVDDGGTRGNPTDDRIVYTPANGFVGTDKLDYQFQDANGDPAMATLTISVEDANQDRPVAADDVLTVAQDSTATSAVLANDSFGSDGPTATAIALVAGPGNGVATIDDGSTPSDPTDDRIDYTPDAGFTGSDSFDYRIADADGDTATATVTVKVKESADTPAAGDDVTRVNEDDSVIVAVLVNDDFGGNGPGTSTVKVVGGPAHGTAAVNDNGTASDPADDQITYTPNTDFFGSDSFDYRIEDVDGDLATATVTVTVDPVNDAPSVDLAGNPGASSGTGEQSIPGFASNFEPGTGEAGQSIVAFVVSNDNHALFDVQPEITNNGTLTFTPSSDNAEGTAKVTVQVRDDGGTDNGGQSLSEAQTFTISIGVLADVQISVSGPPAAEAATEATFTVKVVNYGPSQAEGVVVSVDMPRGTTFVSAGSPCTGGFPCSIDGLSGSPAAAGGSRKQPGRQAIAAGGVVEFDATFRLGGHLSGNEEVIWETMADTGDPNLSNNADRSHMGVAAMPVPVMGPFGLAALMLLVLGVAVRRITTI